MGLLERLRAATEPRAAASQGSTGVPHEFAFVDVETSGLDARVDRIVEVGVLITDARGTVRDEFCTLVRPDRGAFEMNPHARRVNLIDPAWLAAAPPTSAVLVEVAHRVHGRVVVAHNAMFDIDFLENEFKRCLGYTDADLGDWTTLCTMDLCEKVDVPRGLERACFTLGVRYEKHNAIGDCHATAHLLHYFMRVIDPATFSGRRMTTLGRLPEWAAVNRVGRTDAQAMTTARPVLHDVVASLPLHDGSTDRDPTAAAAYLTVLQDAIADGYISAEEVAALESTAARFGLTSDELRDLHQELVLGLIDTALGDRKISRDERADIETVATWLDVDVSDWDTMVRAARARIKAAVKSFRDEIVGKKVAFSGAGIHQPNIREALALKHKFAYLTTVEGADLLVIGTEQTDTAQVRKAHELGAPIMVESSFWRRLGEV